MKLSFVIPAYNEEAYLPLCLDAILREKNKGKYDMEIIVVNNGSTDSTKSIALSYPGVKVVDEFKKGLTIARQAGYLVATGDLIANIDSDSILTLGWLDTVMERFSKNSNLMALSGPVIYYDLSIFSNFLIRIQYNIDYVVYLINRFIFKTNSLLQGSNFIVRKSALDKIGGFNTAFPFWGEDANIAKRLNPLGPVIFTFKLLVYSSGRRFKEEGLLVLGTKYAVNFFWTIFFDKPFLTSYADIRRPKFSQNSFKTDLARFNKVLLYAKVGFVFVVFSLLGGSAFIYDRMVWTVQPVTAAASAILVEEHPILSKVHSSIARVKEKIKVLEEEFDSDKD